MAKDDELLKVTCLKCNDFVFQFSKNLLEASDNDKITLICPKCELETLVIKDSIQGIIIRKNW